MTLQKISDQRLLFLVKRKRRGAEQHLTSRWDAQKSQELDRLLPIEETLASETTKS